MNRGRIMEIDEQECCRLGKLQIGCNLQKKKEWSKQIHISSGSRRLTF